MPLKTTASSVSRRKARIRLAPSASPEGSPAIKAMRKDRASAIAKPDDEQAEPVGCGSRGRRVDPQGRTGLDGDAGEARRRRILVSGPAASRQHDTAILLRLARRDDGSCKRVSDSEDIGGR